MLSFTDMISLARIFSFRYHLLSKKVIENFHRSLKQMKRLELPREWDRYIPIILFAYREVPQKSTGISIHELIFGGSISGPVSLLRNMLLRPDVPYYKT